MKNNLMLVFILLITLAACSINEKSELINERSIASMINRNVEHRPFFIIMHKNQSQDSRLNKEQTEKLIEKSSNKICADQFLRKIVIVFDDQEVKEQIDAIFNEYGIEIHLGGVYQDELGKIRFDQIIQAHIPGTTYHRAGQPIYQVRAYGEKIEMMRESILSEEDEYKIEFLNPDCEVDRADKNTYIKMLKVLRENIQSAIKNMNEGKIKNSPTGHILRDYF